MIPQRPPDKIHHGESYPPLITADSEQVFGRWIYRVLYTYPGLPTIENDIIQAYMTEAGEWTKETRLAGVFSKEEADEIVKMLEAP